MTVCQPLELPAENGENRSVTEHPLRHCLPLGHGLRVCGYAGEPLSLIRECVGKKSCRKRELESLLGHLQHAATVVRPGRTFVRRLIELVAAFKHADHWIRLSGATRSDLIWWLTFMEGWNGVYYPIRTRSYPTHWASFLSLLQYLPHSHCGPVGSGEAASDSVVEAPADPSPKCRTDPFPNLVLADMTGTSTDLPPTTYDPPTRPFLWCSTRVELAVAAWSCLIFSNR